MASEPRNFHRIKSKERKARLNARNRKKMSKKILHRILNPIKRRKSSLIKLTPRIKITSNKSLQRKFKLMYRRKKLNERAISIFG